MSSVAFIATLVWPHDGPFMFDSIKSPLDCLEAYLDDSVTGSIRAIRFRRPGSCCTADDEEGGGAYQKRKGLRLESPMHR
jgi:hypothetical protein